MVVYSWAQLTALAVIPKISGLSSIVGSAWIVFEVVKDPTKLKKTYHRLVFMMSACNFFVSFAKAYSTWPVPATKENENVNGAIGNVSDCTIQGFFVQLGNTIVPMYNIALSIYFLLVIKYNYSNKRTRDIEWMMHAACFGTAFALSIVGLVPGLDLYNYDQFGGGSEVMWCSMSSYPSGCLSSYENNGVTTCERGNNAALYELGLFYAPLWSMILLSAIIMIQLYRFVQQQEHRTPKWTTARLQRTKNTLHQATFFICAFYITWICTSINRLLEFGNVQFFALVLGHAVLSPSQGFMNFFVYMRPTILKYMKKKLAQKKRRDQRQPDLRSSLRDSLKTKHATALRENSLHNNISSSITNANRKRRLIRFAIENESSSSFKSVRSVDSATLEAVEHGIGMKKENNFGSSEFTAEVAKKRQETGVDATSAKVTKSLYSGFFNS